MKKLKELPPCMGYTIHSMDGNDFDCEYENPPECERCLCNWFLMGGTINPVNGKKLTEKKATELYGENYD